MYSIVWNISDNMKPINVIPRMVDLDPRTTKVGF